MKVPVLAKIHLGRVLNYFEQGLFYLLIFLLPVQAGLEVFKFGTGSFEVGVVKGLDVLGLGLLAVWALRTWLMGSEASRLTAHQSARPLVLAGLLFLAVAALSLIFALDPLLGLYQWLRLALMIGLFFYVVFNSGRLNWRAILWLLVAAGLVQAALAGVQFFSQADLGLQVLGEPALGPMINGVAKVEAGGQKIVRGYGLLPHPNVLGAFLILSIFSLLGLFLGDEKGRLSSGRMNSRRIIASRATLYFSFSLLFFILIFGLFVTFSRSAWLAGALAGLLVLSILAKNRGRASVSWWDLGVLGAVLVLAVVLLGGAFAPLLQERLSVLPNEPAVVLRGFYLQAAGRLFQAAPILGVGLGQFVLNLKLINADWLYPEWFFQPVHNLYALVAVETGLVGLVAFAVLLGLVLRAGFKLVAGHNQPQTTHQASASSLFIIRCSLFAILAAFLLIGFFDHFFWTMPAGQYLFWLSLGLIGGAALTNSN